MLALTTSIKHISSSTVWTCLWERRYTLLVSRQTFRTLRDLCVDFFFPSLLEIGHNLLLFCLSSFSLPWSLPVLILQTLVSSFAISLEVGLRYFLSSYNGLKLLWVKSCIIHTKMYKLKSKLLHHVPIKNRVIEDVTD